MAEDERDDQRDDRYTRDIAISTKAALRSYIYDTQRFMDTQTAKIDDLTDRIRALEDWRTKVQATGDEQKRGWLTFERVVLILLGLAQAAEAVFFITHGR